MRDYDQYLRAQYGPDLDGEVDKLFYCADAMCDGHAVPGARCTDPLDNTDEDEETCP